MSENSDYDTRRAKVTPLVPMAWPDRGSRRGAFTCRENRKSPTDWGACNRARGLSQREATIIWGLIQRDV